MSKAAGDRLARSQNAEIRAGARTKRNLHSCGNRVHQFTNRVLMLTTKQQPSHDHDFLANHWGLADGAGGEPDSVFHGKCHPETQATVVSGIPL